MNLILLGIIGAAIILLGILVAVSYVKCPPDMVYLISGIKKEPRVITGKAAFRIPFFERIDRIPLKLIQVDVRANNVPTNDFINVDVDAVANIRISTKTNLIQVAAKHFLNQSTKDIAINVQQILEGNMREIIGQMKLTDLVNNKQLFSQKIQENAIDDIEKLGLEIVNLNVQNVTDDNDAILNLGVDNLAQIQKNAKIARAQAEKEVKVAEAAADEEGARARAAADAKIAEQQKELAIKKAEYKIEQDKKKADADAAYEIQKAIQQKTINENEVDAEVARTEKMTSLKEKEVALKEQQLEAEIKKQADAERYAAEVQAEVDKVREIKKAEAEAEARVARANAEASARMAHANAERDANIKEAEGIRAKLEAEAAGKKAILLAEAEGLKAKALAEAEGIEKKAEAQKKMGEASIIEMVMAALPQVAKEVSAPLANVDNITMYGDQSTQFIENNTQKIDKVFKTVMDSTGLDLKSVIAGFAANKLINKDNNKED